MVMSMTPIKPRYFKHVYVMGDTTEWHVQADASDVDGALLKVICGGKVLLKRHLSARDLDQLSKLFGGVS